MVRISACPPKFMSWKVLQPFAMKPNTNAISPSAILNTKCGPYEFSDVSMLGGVVVVVVLVELVYLRMKSFVLEKIAVARSPGVSGGVLMWSLLIAVTSSEPPVAGAVARSSRTAGSAAACCAACSAGWT